MQHAPAAWTLKLSRILVYAVGISLVLIAAVAVSSCFLPYDWIRSRLDAYSGDGSADAFTVAVHQRVRLLLAAVAITSGVIAVAIWFYRARVIKLVDYAINDCQLAVRELYKETRPTLPWLAASAACLAIAYIAIASRFSDEPIRYDEAHTYLNYVSQPVFITITRYDAPNNHILYSLLAKLSISLFGDSVFTLRLPALIDGTLLIIAVLIGGWYCCHPAVGIAAALLLLGNPTLIEAGSNARGHVTGALFLVLATINFEWSCRTAHRVLPLTLCAISIALALFTVPTTLYGLFGLFIWALLRSISISQISRPKRLAITLSTFVAGGLLAALLYAPLIATNDPASLVSVAAANTNGVFGLVKQLPAYASKAWENFMWDVPHLLNLAFLASLIASLFTIFIWLAVSSSPVRRGCAINTIFAVIAGLLTLLAAAIHRTLPPERSIIFLLPVVAIVISSCLFYLLDGFSLKQTHWVGTVLALTFTSFTTRHTLHEEQIHKFYRHATVREGSALADWLHENALQNQPIIAVTPESATVVYFFHKHAWDMSHFIVPQPSSNYDQGALVLTHDGFQPSPLPVLQELKLDNIFDNTTAQQVFYLGESRVWHLKQKSRSP